MRGRSKSKGLVRRNKSKSKNGTRPPPKTQSVRVEKFKVVPVTVDKEPLPIAQSNTEDGTNNSREQVPVTSVSDDGASEKSEQEIDPTLWKEVLPKKKKKSKKKKKADSPQPIYVQRCVPKGKEIVVERKCGVNERNQNNGNRTAGIVINEEINKHANTVSPTLEDSSPGILAQREKRGDFQGCYSYCVC